MGGDVGPITDRIYGALFILKELALLLKSVHHTLERRQQRNNHNPTHSLVISKQYPNHLQENARKISLKVHGQLLSAKQCPPSVNPLDALLLLAIEASKAIKSHAVSMSPGDIFRGFAIRHDIIVFCCQCAYMDVRSSDAP